MRKENSKITSIAAGICFVVYGIIGLFFSIKSFIDPFLVDIFGTPYLISHHGYGNRFADAVVLLYTLSSLGSISVGLGVLQQKRKLCFIGAISCTVAFLAQTVIVFMGYETTHLSYVVAPFNYKFIFISSALCWFLIFICFKKESLAAGIIAGGMELGRFIFICLLVLVIGDNGYNTMKPECLCTIAVFALVLAYIFSAVAFSSKK